MAEVRKITPAEARKMVDLRVGYVEKFLKQPEMYDETAKKLAVTTIMLLKGCTDEKLGEELIKEVMELAGIDQKYVDENPPSED